MEALYNITLIFLMAWFLVSFQPLHNIFNIIIMKVKNQTMQFVLALIQSILSCQKCASFWIGLAITGDIFIALAASFISHLWDKFQSRI